MWFHEIPPPPSFFFSAIYPQINLLDNTYLRLSIDPLKLMGVLLLTLMGLWLGLICIQEVCPSWRWSGKSMEGHEELMQFHFFQVPRKNLSTLWPYFCPVMMYSFILLFSPNFFSVSLNTFLPSLSFSCGGILLSYSLYCQNRKV